MYNTPQNNRQTKNNQQVIPAGKTEKIQNNNSDENPINQIASAKAKGNKIPNNVRKGEEIGNNFINNFTANPALVNINPIQYHHSMLNSSRYLFK